MKSLDSPVRSLLLQISYWSTNELARRMSHLINSGRSSEPSRKARRAAATAGLSSQIHSIFASGTTGIGVSPHGISSMMEETKVCLNDVDIQMCCEPFVAVDVENS